MTGIPGLKLKTAVFDYSNGEITHINGKPANGESRVGKPVDGFAGNPQLAPFIDKLTVTVVQVVVVGDFPTGAGARVEVGDGDGNAFPVVVTSLGTHQFNAVLGNSDNGELMAGLFGDTINKSGRIAVTYSVSR